MLPIDAPPHAPDVPKGAKRQRPRNKSGGGYRKDGIVRVSQVRGSSEKISSDGRVRGALVTCVSAPSCAVQD